MHPAAFLRELCDVDSLTPVRLLHPAPAEFTLRVRPSGPKLSLVPPSASDSPFGLHHRTGAVCPEPSRGSGAMFKNRIHIPAVLPRPHLYQSLRLCASARVPVLMPLSRGGAEARREFFRRFSFLRFPLFFYSSSSSCSFVSISAPLRLCASSCIDISGTQLLSGGSRSRYFSISGTSYGRKAPPFLSLLTFFTSASTDTPRTMTGILPPVTVFEPL